MEIQFAYFSIIYPIFRLKNFLFFLIMIFLVQLFKLAEKLLELINIIFEKIKYHLDYFFDRHTSHSMCTVCIHGCVGYTLAFHHLFSFKKVIDKSRPRINYEAHPMGWSLYRIL